jgi:primosomal replication protein N
LTRQAQNRVTLDATLAEAAALRYTPAGIPAFDGLLRHASRQLEAGGERAVDCEIAALAYGDAARALAELAPGTPIRCHGFLARRYRTGVTLALHVNAFELTERD